MNNNQLFYELITDIKRYLSEYMDITKIEKQYEETKYVLTKDELNKIKVDEDIIEIKIKQTAGATVTPINYTKKGYKMEKTVCFVRQEQENSLLKNIIFHELMHVGSTNQELVRKTKLIFKTGIYSKLHKPILFKKSENFLYLNEAMTELVAKFIYDNLYDEKYKIIEIENKKYSGSVYERGYFLLAFLLLNYFEEHPKELFEIYFNNNIKLFEKVLKENTNFTLKKLNKYVNKIQENLNDFDLYCEYRELIAELEEKNPIRNSEVKKQFEL